MILHLKDFLEGLSTQAVPPRISSVSNFRPNTPTPADPQNTSIQLTSETLGASR